MNDVRLTMTQIIYIVNAAQQGDQGDTRSFTDTATGKDTLRVLRVGPKDYPTSRVAVHVVEDGVDNLVWLSPRQARALAAALMDLADEIDGTD